MTDQWSAQRDQRARASLRGVVRFTGRFVPFHAIKSARHFGMEQPEALTTASRSMRAREASRMEVDA